MSRQREFLADASAVQFTRNPSGISGALKAIGGYSHGSLLHEPAAAEFSHMYFGQGVANALGKMMATHPPLQDRILRIEPSWKGEFPKVSPVSASSEEALVSSFSAPQSPGTQDTEIETAQTETSVIDSIGQPTAEHVEQAKQILGGIPDSLKEAAHDSFSARALIYGLLVVRDKNTQNHQLTLLKDKSHPVVYRQLLGLKADLEKLSIQWRLPLLELSIPALKSLSPTQYQLFKRNLIILIRADKKVDLFEWSLFRIIVHNIEDRANTGQNKKLKDLAYPCQLLLSTLAHSGHTDSHQTQIAFDAAMKELPFNLPALPGSAIKIAELDKAIIALNQLNPLQKPMLLKAMAQCVIEDGVVKAGEAELFRAIADSLDCPVPPLLPKQNLI